MRPHVTSSFSHDLIKMPVDYLRYLQCYMYTVFTQRQVLNGTTSILVLKSCLLRIIRKFNLSKISRYMLLVSSPYPSLEILKIVTRDN